jgi:hypothetical protein
MASSMAWETQPIWAAITPEGASVQGRTPSAGTNRAVASLALPLEDQLVVLRGAERGDARSEALHLIAVLRLAAGAEEPRSPILSEPDMNWRLHDPPELYSGGNRWRRCLNHYRAETRDLGGLLARRGICATEPLGRLRSASSRFWPAASVWVPEEVADRAGHVRPQPAGTSIPAPRHHPICGTVPNWQICMPDYIGVRPWETTPIRQGGCG